MDRRDFHTAFDKAMPVHIKALYQAYLSVYAKGRALLTTDHECNCEYCDLSDDEQYILPGKEEEYKSLREEQIEIADTLRRCLSWAKFKNIQVDDVTDDLRWNKLEDL